MTERKKEYLEFADFVRKFIDDLNHSSEDGWSILVEGSRDVLALRRLGFRGTAVTSSALVRRGSGAFGTDKVIVLTDLDREGQVLASRFVKRLSHEGLKSSLAERRRLRQASKGVFLHVENLVRFADVDV